MGNRWISGDLLFLDGSRIGVDLWLYKEVGSSKIPCDKREMKVVLGEENLFYRQSERI